MKFAIRRADTTNDAIYRKRYAHAMKSCFARLRAADLISSEALAEDFIQTCLDFILLCRISFLLFFRIYAILNLR